MRYTKEQIEFIYKNYKGISSQELTIRFNDKFGTDRDSKVINAFKSHHGLKSGYNNHFKKGNIPWNTGTKGLTKANSGSRKPVPIGSKYMKYGKALIKTDTGWKQYSRYVYEKYHDCKLNSNERIYFLDGNNRNFSKKNLTKVTKQEIARIHHEGYFFNNPELNKAGINIVRLKMKVREIDANDRKDK